MFRRAVIVLIAAPLALPCASPVQARVRAYPAIHVQDTWVIPSGFNRLADPSPRYCPGEAIVQFTEGCPVEDRGLILAQYGCSIAQTCEPGRFHRVTIPPEETLERMVSVLEADEAVAYAELNYYASIYLVPDDPFFFPYQWDLQNDVTGGINMEAAWDIETGDPNLIVAVLDTGIAYEDYRGFWQAPDLAQTRFVPGYDFVNDDTHANDDQGHGTHITGTIAQSTNNEEGVAGIAFGCSIMPVKVLADDGIGDYFDIARAIYFATDNGARVINMSLGSPDRSITIEQAMAYAYGQGVTIVCAAGNDFEDGNPPSYPAAYDDYCIAVGAVRYDDTRSYYSNTGSYIDVVAPGGDLLIDQNGDGYPDGILQQTFTIDSSDFGYYFFQGTSSATPHVSGVAALLISHGVTDPDAVRAAIEGTARDVGPLGWDPQHGWGVVDAHAALLYQVP